MSDQHNGMAPHSGFVFDNRVTTGNILTIIGGMFALFLAWLAMTNEAVATTGRINGHEIRLIEIEKRLERERADNIAYKADVLNALRRIEDRLNEER